MVDSVKINTIISALRTRELEIQSSQKQYHSANGLFFKGKPQSDPWKSNNKPLLNDEKMAKQKKKCKYCKKKEHLIQDYFFLKKKNQEKEKDSK